VLELPKPSYFVFTERGKFLVTHSSKMNGCNLLNQQTLNSRIPANRLTWKATGFVWPTALPVAVAKSLLEPPAYLNPSAAVPLPFDPAIQPSRQGHVASDRSEFHARTPRIFSLLECGSSSLFPLHSVHLIEMSVPFHRSAVESPFHRGADCQQFTPCIMSALSTLNFPDNLPFVAKWSEVRHKTINQT